MLPQKSPFSLLMKLKREIWVKVQKSVPKSHNFPSRWYVRGTFGKKKSEIHFKTSQFLPSVGTKGEILEKKLDNLHLKTHSFPLLFKGEIVEKLWKIFKKITIPVRLPMGFKGPWLVSASLQACQSMDQAFLSYGKSTAKSRISPHWWNLKGENLEKL